MLTQSLPISEVALIASVVLLLISHTRVLAEHPLLQPYRDKIYRIVGGILDRFSGLEADSWWSFAKATGLLSLLVAGAMVVLSVVVFGLGFRHRHLEGARYISWFFGLVLSLATAGAAVAFAIAFAAYVTSTVLYGVGIAINYLRQYLGGSTGALTSLALLTVAAAVGALAGTWIPLIVLATFQFLVGPTLLWLARRRRPKTDEPTSSPIDHRLFLRRLWRVSAAGAIVAAASPPAIIATAVAGYMMHDAIWHHREKVSWESSSESVMLTPKLEIDAWRLGTVQHKPLLYRPHIVPLPSDDSKSVPAPILVIALKSDDVSQSRRHGIFTMNMFVRFRDRETGDTLLLVTEGMAMPFINGFGTLYVFDDSLNESLAGRESCLIEIGVLYEHTYEEATVGYTYQTRWRAILGLSQTEREVVRFTGGSLELHDSQSRMIFDQFISDGQLNVPSGEVKTKLLGRYNRY